MHIESIITDENLPSQWATQLETPIPKVLKPSHRSKFRPTSINNRIARVSKSIVSRWLKEFYSAIGIYQFGFKDTLAAKML